MRRVSVASYWLLPVPVIWKAHQAAVALRGAGPEAAAASASAAHTAIAQRMLGLALANGGIYVKGGQHICAQPIVPAEYSAVLRVLMSHAQRHPLGQARTDCGWERAGAPHGQRAGPAPFGARADCSLPAGVQDALTFEEDVGMPFEDAFDSFDPEPFASASLAQVGGPEMDCASAARGPPPQASPFSRRRSTGLCWTAAPLR